MLYWNSILSAPFGPPCLCVLGNISPLSRICWGCFGSRFCLLCRRMFSSNQADLGKNKVRVALPDLFGSKGNLPSFSVFVSIFQPSHTILQIYTRWSNTCSPYKDPYEGQNRCPRKCWFYRCHLGVCRAPNDAQSSDQKRSRSCHSFTTSSFPTSRNVLRAALFSRGILRHGWLWSDFRPITAYKAATTFWARLYTPREHHCKPYLRWMAPGFSVPVHSLWLQGFPLVFSEVAQCQLSWAEQVLYMLGVASPCRDETCFQKWRSDSTSRIPAHRMPQLTSWQPIGPSSTRLDILGFSTCLRRRGLVIYLSFRR